MLVTAVPIAALAALGGAYPSSTFPLLVAASAAFLISGGIGLFSAPTRALDWALLVFLCAIVVQFMPLPPALVAAVSPDSLRLQSVLQLDVPRTWRSLSIDDRLTRDALASAAAAVLVFWAARETFSRGGLRAAARVVAISGAVAALVGLAQRATAPGTLLWIWKLPDPGAKPFGPFVNRNHFATWLLMALALTGGYLVAHVRSHRLLASRSRRLLIHDLLADGTTLLLAACTGAILLALFGSGSRGALAGLGVAALMAVLFGRRAGASRSSLIAGGAVLAGAFATAIWVNAEVLASRMVVGTEVPRSTIWHETMPIVRDFPWTGTGLGTYRWAMLVYQQSKSELLFNQAHNEYLQLVAEGGVLLTIPAIAALVAWLLLATRRMREDRGELAALRVAALAGIAGAAMQCVWDSTLRMPANAMLFALLAAVVVHERRSGVRSRSAATGSRRGEAPAAPR